MASGHYCSIHKTPFFKTKNMRGYAHPIKDAAGNTIQGPDGKDLWCNEIETPLAQPTPAQAAPAQQPQAAPQQSYEEWHREFEVEKQASIEGQNALTNLTNLAIAKMLEKAECDALTITLFERAGLRRSASPLVAAVQAEGGVVVKKGTKQFPNIGAFLNTCWKEHQLQRPEVEAILGQPITDTTDLDGAYAFLLESIKAK